PLGTPRRAVVGWDQARLSMVLAVLDARCGFAMAGRDVFLTITGGLRIGEPAADLAAAAALISSATGAVVPEKTVVFGEIGLSGGVRAVSQSEARLREAAKLGFTTAWVPPLRGAGYAGPMKLIEISKLSDLVTLIGGEIDAGVAPASARGGA
ncbi:MAG: DNA repair protein RadA, partial [Alphaproteobacteria bacterium]|nr:DNA repair protein RadA [Alphaproteobacteria bacterium]